MFFSSRECDIQRTEANKTFQTPGERAAFVGRRRHGKKITAPRVQDFITVRPR
jgi:hypothetical protein